jgi:hypothetical protein
MHDDSGSVTPAQVEEPDGATEFPTAAAELRIFLVPVSQQKKRGWIPALTSRLRRG